MGSKPSTPMPRPPKAPPGMTQERWHLYQLQRRRHAGEDVRFTLEQVELLHDEALALERSFTPDEIRAIVEAGGF